MDYKIFTTGHPTRKFFASPEERDLIRGLRVELNLILSSLLIDKSIKDKSVSELYSYIDFRMLTLYNNSVNSERVKAYLKDYCDIRWQGITGKSYKLPYRMLKFSEPISYN